jgi:NodT family efflux transporter outer membrane factor (OMF) lipoprotein
VTSRGQRNLSFAAALAAALSACAVGPDFETPAPPDVARFTPEKTTSPGNGQRFNEGASVPARWWTAFGSTELDALIQEALDRNPTLEAADAAIRIAQYNADAATGVFFPQVVLNSNSSYQIYSSDATTSTVTQSAYSFFSKQVQISYTPDIWGGNRRTLEGLEAQRDMQGFQKEAAFLTLAADVAKAAIEEASLRAQIAATRRIIDLEQERLTLLERQLAYGAVAGTDILLQQSALAQARQTLPDFERRLAAQRNLLTALAGRYPSQEVGETFDLAHIALPRELPVSLPAGVVAQRPDIKAAEASVHSASAQVGVAVAARLPNVTLTANGGTSAFQLAQLFTPGTGFYALAGNIAQTAFDGMTLLNKQKAAEAGLEQAEAQYRDTVIKAFRNVADTLRALQSDARAVKEARVAEGAAKKYLDKIRSQLKFGGVSQLAVVDAQRTLLNASITRVQAEAQRLTDTVALFVALGGGWRS